MAHDRKSQDQGSKFDTAVTESSVDALAEGTAAQAYSMKAKEITVNITQNFPERKRRTWVWLLGSGVAVGVALVATSLNRPVPFARFADDQVSCVRRSTNSFECAVRMSGLKSVDRAPGYCEGPLYRISGKSNGSIRPRLPSAWRSPPWIAPEAPHDPSPPPELPLASRPPPWIAPEDEDGNFYVVICWSATVQQLDFDVEQPYFAWGTIRVARRTYSLRFSPSLLVPGTQSLPIEDRSEWWCGCLATQNHGVCKHGENAETECSRLVDVTLIGPKTQRDVCERWWRVELPLGGRVEGDTMIWERGCPFH